MPLELSSSRSLAFHSDDARVFSIAASFSVDSRPRLVSRSSSHCKKINALEVVRFCCFKSKRRIATIPGFRYSRKSDICGRELEVHVGRSGERRLVRFLDGNDPLDCNRKRASESCGGAVAE